MDMSLQNGIIKQVNQVCQYQVMQIKIYVNSTKSPYLHVTCCNIGATLWCLS